MSFERIIRDIELLDPADGEGVLNTVNSWLGLFIKTAQPEDLQALTLWAVHTHLVRETYTTPRLLLDSAAPESGKTTVLDHLKRLCFHPVQAASLSSPSLLVRLLELEPRTVLIDEADRALSPKMEGVGELLAVLNSGYRSGASRPVLVPVKGGGWEPVEMSTFGPVAMAGNALQLPDDTRSRCIRVLLLPDLAGTAIDSDWQEIEPYALALHDAVAGWSNGVRKRVAEMRPNFSAMGLAVLRGRNKERWAPLFKVAAAAGGRWPQWCETLIEQDLEQQKADREGGLQQMKRHILLLSDVFAVWPEGKPFVSTSELLALLRGHAPEKWGQACTYGQLTAQGFGRMLVNNFNIRATRQPSGERLRGYYRTSFEPAFKAFGLLD